MADLVESEPGRQRFFFPYPACRVKVMSDA
jgi:hypothetical protein